MLNIVPTLKFVFVYGYTVVKIDGLFADERQLNFFFGTHFLVIFVKPDGGKDVTVTLGKYLNEGWGKGEGRDFLSFGSKLAWFCVSGGECLCPYPLVSQYY